MRIERIDINGIPAITYELSNDNTKPLIFFFHGFTGNKNNLMGRGEVLAELGFYVVAFDAIYHGQRNEEWFDKLTNLEKYPYIVDIEINTAKEAKELYENFFIKHNRILKDGYYAYGVSMGAAVTFYLATIDKNLKSAVTLVGSPSFVEYYKERQIKFNWSNDIVSKRLKEYQLIDPLINYDRLSNTKIWMGLGEHDQVVVPKFSIELSKKLPDTTILKMYNTAHESTKEMLQDSYEFLENEIATKRKN